MATLISSCLCFSSTLMYQYLYVLCRLRCYHSMEHDVIRILNGSRVGMFRWVVSFISEFAWNVGPARGEQGIYDQLSVSQ